MAIVKSIPSQKVINGLLIKTSEISVVSELEYKTTGESCIITKGVEETKLILDSESTDHVVIKVLNSAKIKPSIGKIDEKYDEIVINNGACVEFRFCLGNWYILSSDGLKYD